MLMPKLIIKFPLVAKVINLALILNLLFDVYARAAKLPNLEIHGITMHIGSQINKIEPFKAAFEKMHKLCLEIRNAGYKISSLDFGGGIGILYKDENTLMLDAYAKLIKEITQDLNVEITIAPGRSIVGSAGIMVTSIIFVKEAINKNFLIIDAAMNDLMRPSLYDSYHEVLPERKNLAKKSCAIWQGRSVNQAIF